MIVMLVDTDCAVDFHPCSSQFAMLLCWLPAQVGAVSDFARVEKLGEAAMTDFVGRRYSGEAGHKAPEGVSRARHGERSSRQTRTSTTFATEPSSEPYSFQVFLTPMSLQSIGPFINCF